MLQISMYHSTSECPEFAQGFAVHLSDYFRQKGAASQSCMEYSLNLSF